MNQTNYVPRTTFVNDWIEVTKTAYTKIEARHAAWQGLTETQRDHVESIECIEQVAA